MGKFNQDFTADNNKIGVDVVETLAISNRISKIDRMLNHINRFLVPQITCVAQHISIKITFFSLRNTVIKIALEVTTCKQLVETNKANNSNKDILDANEME